MTRDKILEAINVLYPDDSYTENVLLADGFEDAFEGLATQFDGEPKAVYDYDKCVTVLMDRDGMSFDEAEEFMSYNVLGAWAGEHTPFFLRKIKENEFLCEKGG